VYTNNAKLRGGLNGWALWRWPALRAHRDGGDLAIVARLTAGFAPAFALFAA